MIKVTFRPDGRFSEATPGQRLIDVARGVGVGIAADCGGKGKCGKCRVRFDLNSAPSGTLSEPAAQEKMLLPEATRTHFFRLACRTRVYKDATVIVPEKSQTADDSLRKPVTPYAIPIRPAVSRMTFNPNHQDKSETAQPLMERVKGVLPKTFGLEARDLSLSVMGAFSRAAGFSQCRTMTATLYKGREILQLLPEKHSSLYGVALDIGTTAVGAFLCELTTGEVVASATSVNPQRIYGADVISRITQIQKDPSSLKTLQKMLTDAINTLIRQMAGSAGISREDIVDLVAVGNPTMQHFFLGFSPLSIGQAPYLPLCYQGGEMEAGDLNLYALSSARVHVLPMLSGFVGGDTLAALLTGAPEDFEGIKLVVDVGTNGELVLSKNGELSATSCATGPAFEGSQIECGMLAGPGAIEKAWFDADTASIGYQVIGNRDGRGPVKPAGLCGSGVISTVSTLVSAGFLKKNGAFDQAVSHPGLRKNEASGMVEMVIAPASRSQTGRDIVITQNDIRAVQMGKAALMAGVQILMEEAGVNGLDKIFLAGTFGNHLDPDDLVTLGMLSPLDRDRIEPIGNAAGDGARLALFNVEKRQQAMELAKRIRVLELTSEAEFSHGICQECAEKYYPDMDLYGDEGNQG